MKLLLTNDDGIDAPGLRALQQAAAIFGEATVLAPDSHHSGCGHQVTTHRGLKLQRDADGRYRLDGTPGDCVRIGLTQLGADFDWVFAGVNDGGNLGVDIHMSGTVAAAREAALLGKRAIAISQYRRRELAIDWQRATTWAQQILTMLLERSTPTGTFYNVNLPALEPGAATPPVEYCPVDPHALPVGFRCEDGVYHYAGRYQDRRQEPDHDVAHCFAGSITISEFRMGSWK